MAYEPTTWKSGDVVTSAKLNKIEGGIASGGVLVVTDNDGTLDKTWQEIHDAAAAVIKANESGQTSIVFVTYIGSDGDVFEIIAGITTYLTSNANGYPVYSNTEPSPDIS